MLPVRRSDRRTPEKSRHRPLSPEPDRYAFETLFETVAVPQFVQQRAEYIFLKFERFLPNVFLFLSAVCVSDVQHRSGSGGGCWSTRKQTALRKKKKHPSAQCCPAGRCRYCSRCFSGCSTSSGQQRRSHACQFVNLQNFVFLCNFFYHMWVINVFGELIKIQKIWTPPVRQVESGGDWPRVW